MVAAVLVALALLLWIGNKGRHLADVQERLDQISEIQDDLRRETENEELLKAEYFVAPDLNANRGSPLGERGRALTGTLENALRQFDADYSASRLSSSQDRQLGLARATQANTQGRYTDALTLVDSMDWRSGSGESGEESKNLALSFRVRGDSYYGLQKWKECLDCYQRIPVGSLRTLIVNSRVAECLYNTGRLQEALGWYESLAVAENERGNTLLVQAKTSEATPLYERALKLQTWLMHEHGRTNVAANMATTCNNLGSAFLIEESPTNATALYQEALRIWNDPGTQTSQSGLAYSHQHLADALFGQQNLNAAIEEYGRGIAILKQLSEKGSNRSSANLAMGLNNRGVTLRAQGQIEAALKDFDAADKIASSAKEEESDGPKNEDLGNQENRMAQVTPIAFDVVMEYNENGVEVSTHAGILGNPKQNDLILLRAVITKNRGYARLSQGKTRDGLADLDAAAGLYSRINEADGQMDVSAELAMTLNSIAWVQATNPDNSARDGIKATKYARRACDLTDWRDVTPVVTLAAACAEAGNYDEAVKWESKAVELAPEAAKADLRSREDLYRAQKPYRASTR